MFRLLKSAVLLATMLFTTVSIYAQVTIDKTAKENVTLLYRGVNGNSELSAQVQSDLLNCGWFNVVSSGNADYIVSGTANGNLMKLDLMNGAGVMDQSFSVSGTDTSVIAHTAVDSILKHLYNIEGICKTKIIFAAETSPGMKDIYICDFDGKNIKRLTQNNTLCLDPKWNPSGKTIVYSYFGRSYTHLVELDLVTNLSRRLTRYNGINAGGRISPDGKYVALILALDNRVDLYIRETNGSQLKRITNDKAVEASPCWSPDGKAICYVSDKTGRPRLYIVNPFATNPSPVHVQGTKGSERVVPSWSKDNKIAYSAKLGDYTVAVVDLSSGTPEDVPTGSQKVVIPGEGPSWAPDNRHVVVAHQGVLYVVDTRLGRVRTLVQGSTKLSGPDWSPILY